MTPEAERTLLSTAQTKYRPPDAGTSFAPAEGELRDAAPIALLMRSLFANQRRVIVRSLQSPSTLARPGVLTPHGRLLVEWAPGDDMPGSPIEVEISGLYADYRLHFEAPWPPGSPIPMPSRVARLHRRSYRRAVCPGGATVSFENPDRSGGFVERAVRDVSFGGISFSISPDDGLVCGEILPTLRLRWKRGLELTLRGVVRHISASMHGDGDTCGVELVFDDVEARARWDAALVGLVHPNTTISLRQWDALWDLFAHSGYLSLSDKSPAEFESEKSAFERASECLVRNPELGCQVAWPSGNRIEASISLLQAWERAWIVYQLARYPEGRELRHSGNDVLLELYARGYEHMLRNPDLRWHIAYVQDAAKFSRPIHHELPERYNDGERACVVPMHVFEADAVKSATSPDVTRATPSELAVLLQRIAEVRPRAYVEANDFVPDRFWLPSLTEQWGRAGLHRERDVLVAHRDGEPVSAAILDLAEDGLHLFGLLDVVRVIALVPGGEQHFPPLLEAARAWYAERGKAKLIYFEENGLTEAPPTFRSLGGASITVMDRRLIPDMLELVAAMTAPGGRA